MNQAIKWVGTIVILIGVTLNILNNPEYQQYVYPYNLWVNILGSVILLYVAMKDNDRPYILLNLVIGSGYILGVIYG